MIDDLIARLKKADLDLTPEEIADALWLGIQMQQAAPAQRSTPASDSNSGNTDTNREDTPTHRTLPSLPDQAPTIAYLSTLSGSQSEEAPKPSRSIAFKAPEAPALRNPLVLARAMRLLMTKFPSKTETVLDEEETVRQIVDDQIWVPVLKPSPERWFDLVIVVEDSRSVAIWRKAIEEWLQLVKHHGAFRDVRTWYLREDSPAHWNLYPNPRSANTQSRPRHPKELLEPEGRQLILFVSDCVSSLWQQGQAFSLLKIWAKQNSVTLLQLMPERHWGRSVLGRGRFVQFKALFPQPLNHRLLMKPLPVWETPLNLKNALRLPVITFEPDSLSRWSKVMMGSGNTTTAGVVFESEQTMARSRQKTIASQMPSDERVKRFRATASRPARQLAGLMAAAPVSLPVARLIQQTMVPNSGQIHLAEVFLSGLIETPDGTDTSIDPEQVRYEFTPGVREVLLKSIPLSEADEVLHQVSTYIARKAGVSIRSFDALLEMYDSLDEETRQMVAPFAEITPQVLRRLGGVYAEIADELETQKGSGSSQTAGSSPVTLETFEFEVAFIGEEAASQRQEETETAIPDLAPLQFDSVINRYQQNFIGREQVFQAIDRWLQSSNPVLLFLIIGEPGAGKTAVASRLVKFSRGTVRPPVGLSHIQPGFLQAIHFCSSRNPSWIDPTEFTQSIALQLTEAIPEFAQALLEMTRSQEYAETRQQTADLRNQELQQQLENLQQEYEEIERQRAVSVSSVEMVRLTREADAILEQLEQVNSLLEIGNDQSLSQSDRTNLTTLINSLISSLRAQNTKLFHKLVVDPLNLIYRRGFNDRITILIDSLDESMDFQEQSMNFQGQPIAELLTNPTEFPSLVKFIVTSRLTKGIELLRRRKKFIPFEEYLLQPASTVIAKTVSVFLPEETQSPEARYIESSELRETLNFDATAYHEAQNEIYSSYREVLNSVREAIVEKSQGWLLLTLADAVPPQRQQIDYQVTIGSSREFVILDHAGEVIPYLPSLPIDDRNSVENVVRCLIHLAKYQAVQELYSPFSDFIDAVEFELLDESSQPFPEPDNIVLEQGQVVKLRVKNTFPASLNIAVFDLEATWEISQIPIGGIAAPYVTLEPQQEEEILLRFQIADSVQYQRTKETIKLFAARSHANFDRLCLPPLNEQEARGSQFHEDIAAVTSSDGSLAGFLNTFTQEESSALRGAYTIASESEQEWTTQQVTITIRDRGTA